MSEAEKFLRDKSLSFYAENPLYYKGLVLKTEDVIKVMEEYHQSKVNNVVLDDVINSFCPDCGEKGYKTDLTENSYACRNCLAYWTK